MGLDAVHHMPFPLGSHEGRMKSSESKFSFLWLTLPLAACVALTGWGGLFWPLTYARETALWAAEGIGGDAVNLFGIVPLLILSGVLARRGSVPTLFIWTGTTCFLFYFYVLYAFDVHFNSLFLVYCGGLGCSFYGAVMGFQALFAAHVAELYGPRAPVRTIAAVFLFIALMAAAQWLREIIPASFSGRIPQSVTDTGLPTNAVHVLDLSLVLPAFVITAVQLLRRKAPAFVLAPALLVLVILMDVSLAAMGAYMRYKGLGENYGATAFFLAAAVGCTILLVCFFKSKDAQTREELP